MAVKLGNGNWAVKENKLLAYNDNSGRFFNKEFDFSRGSSATYVGKDGLIRRLIYNLLIYYKTETLVSYQAN
tara:strand:- start:37 stop:252 length:216 start_codon:yes stop_codon:yes gene_type:complete